MFEHGRQIRNCYGDKQFIPQCLKNMLSSRSGFSLPLSKRYLQKIPVFPAAGNVFLAAFPQILRPICKNPSKYSIFIAKTSYNIYE